MGMPPFGQLNRQQLAVKRLRGREPPRPTSSDKFLMHDTIWTFTKRYLGSNPTNRPRAAASCLVLSGLTIGISLYLPGTES